MTFHRSCTVLPFSPYLEPCSCTCSPPLTRFAYSIQLNSNSLIWHRTGGKTELQFRSPWWFAFVLGNSKACSLFSITYPHERQSWVDLSEFILAQGFAYSFTITHYLPTVTTELTRVSSYLPRVSLTFSPLPITYPQGQLNWLEWVHPRPGFGARLREAEVRTATILAAPPSAFSAPLRAVCVRALHFAGRRSRPAWNRRNWSVRRTTMPWFDGMESFSELRRTSPSPPNQFFVYVFFFIGWRFFFFDLFLLMLLFCCLFWSDSELLLVSYNMFFPFFRRCF